MREISTEEMLMVSGGSESIAYSLGEAYGSSVAESQISFSTWAIGWCKQIAYTMAY